MCEPIIIGNITYKFINWFQPMINYETQSISHHYSEIMSLYRAHIIQYFLLGPRLTRRVPYSNHSVLLSVRLSVRPSVCPSKNFNIGHNFFTVRDKSFIFGMCDPYDKTFPKVPKILNLWPSPYLACVILMTRPFQRCQKFWTCDLHCDLWPTFEKL